MFKKYRIYFIVLLALQIIYCGKPLPIEEMSTAKMEISRAESYKAGKFAPDEFGNAKKALFASHDYASDEKVSETKVEAEKAAAFAREAVAKSLPLLTREAKDEANKAIEEADNAYASKLAADDYNKAVDLVKEGDAKSTSAEATMATFKTDKKLQTQATSIDQYEGALKNYRDAEEYAKKAITLAMAQKQQIIDSSSDIQDSLAKAGKYGAPQERLALLGEQYSQSIVMVNEGKIKTGLENLENVRKEVNLLVGVSIKDYAEKRKEEARNKVNSADAKMVEAFSLEAIKKTKKESIENAKTQLNAGKEALSSAENMFSQEQYEGSIEQSDEAIRLADISLEQAGLLLASTRDLNNHDESAKSKTKTIKTKKPKTEVAMDGVWKTYKVRKKKPADCLWRIAGYKIHYNNPKLWRRIYKANKGKIKNPNRIYPKQVLIIPPPPGMELNKVQEVRPEAETSEKPEVQNTPEVQPAQNDDAMIVPDADNKPCGEDEKAAPCNEKETGEPTQEMKPSTEEPSAEVAPPVDESDENKVQPSHEVPAMESEDGLEKAKENGAP